MNLKFVFLTFLVLSGALAQAVADPAKQATCIRNTLNKLSEEGRVHAFGIRVTNEANVTLDSRLVGGSLSEITTTAIDRTRMISEAPTTETVAPVLESEKAVVNFADLTRIEKNPLSEVYDANEKKSATTHKISFKETKEQQQSLVKDEVLIQVQCKDLKKKLSELDMNLEADRKLYEELKKKMVTETNPAKIEELKEEIQQAAVKINTIKSEKAVEAKKLEKEEAKLQEVKDKINQIKQESTDLDKEAKEQIVIINGQKVLKKNLQKLTLTEAELKEEQGQLKILEDKAKLVTDSKDAQRISEEIKKHQLKVEELKVQEAKIEKTIRQTSAKVDQAKQVVEEIKKDIKKAEEKEVAKFGSKCTSFSIRPQVKYCISWKTENGKKVCDQYKDVYRVEKCLQTDVSGACIKKTYAYEPNADRYQCESHSTEFAKDQCMEWAEKDGKAVCSKTETFYQSKTCVLFNEVGSEVKCIKYDTAYPAFKCTKTFEVAGKKTCKEMSAYNPTYFCKEYMLVDGHRFCKIQELFYGKEVTTFSCDVKEQMKDANGEVHCMKYSVKKLDQFKDFKLAPIGTETVKVSEAKTPVTERECKKIEKTIQKDKVTIEECKKKILEMEKTITRTKSEVEKLICKKIIMNQQSKIAATEHKIAVEKEIKDKIVSEHIVRQREVAKLRNEKRDAQGRITVEAEIISTCTKKIREAKDQLKKETVPAKVEELKRTISAESEKKKNCQIKIITATKEIQSVDAQIKKSKVNIEVLKLEIQKKDAETLIKKTAETLVQKQKALVEQVKVVKTTVDQTIKNKITAEIRSLEEEIKSGRITLEKEKTTFQKICRKEVAAVQKEAKKEVTKLITKELECKKVIQDMRKIIDNSKRTEEIEVARVRIRTIIEQQAEIKKQIVEIKHKEEVKKIEVEEEKKVLEKECTKTVEQTRKVLETAKVVTETNKKTVVVVDPVTKKVTVEVVPKKTVEVVAPTKKTVEVVIPSKKVEEIKKTIEVIKPTKKTVEVVIPAKKTEEVKKTVEVIKPTKKVEETKKTVEVIKPTKKTVEVVVPTKRAEEIKKTVEVIKPTKKTAEVVIPTKRVEETKKTIEVVVPTKRAEETKKTVEVIKPTKKTLEVVVPSKKVEETKKTVVEETKRTCDHNKKVVIEEPQRTIIRREEKTIKHEEVLTPRTNIRVVETPKKTVIHREVTEEEPVCKEENVVIVKNVIVEPTKKKVVVVEEPKRTVVHNEVKKVIVHELPVKKVTVLEIPTKKVTVVTESHKIVEPKKTCEHEEEIVKEVKPTKKVTINTETKKIVVEQPKVVVHHTKVVEVTKPTKKITVAEKVTEEEHPVIIKKAEIKKQIAHEVREKELAKIERHTAVQIVKDMKREAISRVAEIYRKEKEACVDKTSELKSVLEQADEEVQAETAKKLMKQIRIAEAEKKTSQIILDMLNKIKCTCAVARSHKKLMATVLKKLQAVNPDAIIEFKLFRTKKALKTYLNSHHARYLRQLVRGNRAAYTRRFHSWRVAYRTNHRLVRSYKAGYVYCNRSQRWIKTHSFRVNGKTCGCNKIIKKYKIYTRRTRHYKKVLKRNHVSIRRVNTVRRYPTAVRVHKTTVTSFRRPAPVHCRKRTDPKVPVSSFQVRRPAYRVTSCGRSLQATNLTNNNDVTLIQTFKDHLASFKVEDRSLLAKCLA